MNLLPRENSGAYRVKNALNPLIWVIGLFASPTLVFTLFKGGDRTFTSTFVIISISLVLAVFLFSYLWLLFKDPDRLQSEDFQIRNRAFDLIESQPDGKELDAESIVLITNPDLPRIDSRNGGEG